VGTCDVDSSRKAVAEQFNVPFYQDVQELLEREKPEGVIIATPNGLHAAIAEVCAKRSVHVLIEKPLADTLDDAQRIVKVADETGVQVLVGHHRRHNPLVQHARSIVNGGTLGRLVAVSVLWALLKPDDYYHVDWRCRPPGGGPALINLIHDLDTLRFICGEIRQVYAQSSSAVRQLAVEDSLSITLSFEHGALGSILASDTTASPWSYEATTCENPYYFHADENCYHFLGTLGSLAFPRMEIWRYANANQVGWQYPMEQSRYEVARADPLTSQLDHFCRVVRGEEKPLVDGRDGARSLAVALAVLESVWRQGPIEISLS
jgi:predicted dehydrogenase